MSAFPSQASIFIVEDNPKMREAMESAVRMHEPFTLAGSCETASAAIQWLNRNRPDVLLVDLGLPDGSGLDVIKACAAMHNDCSILVITVFGDDLTVFAAIEAGASGYILKGSGALDIRQTLQDLISGGSPMSPIIARKLLQRFQNSSVSKDVDNNKKKIKQSEIGLTKRETETLELIARGYTYQEVAELMGVSLSTVRTHIRALYGKLAVTSSTEAIFEANKLGLL